MSEHGISATGFSRKRLDELLTELNSEVKTIFGENFNVSPESPDGQINGVVSESNANLWEIAEEAYNAFNPSAASGSTLSNLVQLNGIVRRPASASTVTLSITGTAFTLIPSGSLVSTSDNSVQFSTDVNITLNGSGNGTVTATAVEIGPLEASAGTVTVIDTPISGWDSLTNGADAVLGANEETDPELRARREKSVAINAQSVIDAIFAEINAVQGVTQLTVLENDTTTDPDANGLPAHSFNAVVVGGDNNDIAEAIFLKKPVGITSFGSTLVNVEDSQGIPHNISFTRPVEIEIFVTVTITKFTDYPVTGDTDMKQAIVDYANGQLVSGRGFFLGDDVIYSRLYTPINTIQGHEITDLRIGTSASPTGTSNIAIAFDEISNFDTVNIVVQETP